MLNLDIYYICGIYVCILNLDKYIWMYIKFGHLWYVFITNLDTVTGSSTCTWSLSDGSRSRRRLGEIILFVQGDPKRLQIGISLWWIILFLFKILWVPRVHGTWYGEKKMWSGSEWRRQRETVSCQWEEWRVGCAGGDIYMIWYDTWEVQEVTSAQWLLWLLCGVQEGVYGVLVECWFRGSCLTHSFLLCGLWKTWHTINVIWQIWHTFIYDRCWREMEEQWLI